MPNNYEQILSIQDRLRFFLFHSQLLTSRFLLAISEMIWTITLLWAGDTFSSQTYAGMAAILPENAWGFLFLFACVSQLLILLSGKFHTAYAVTFAAFSMCMHWYVTISMYASVYPPPAGISADVAISIAATLIFIRSGYSPRGCE